MTKKQTHRRNKMSTRGSLVLNTLEKLANDQSANARKQKTNIGSYN
jgi:hypothetical protein